MSAGRDHNRQHRKAEENLLYHQFIARLPEGEFEVEVAFDGDAYRARSRDGEARMIWEELEGGRISLQIDGRPVEVRLARLPDGSLRLEQDGRQVVIRVEDSLSQRARLAHEHHGGPLVLRSPMPGTVVKVLVEEGQSVALEEPLIIIEAMKMQNELAAPASGVIERLTVRAGQAVDGDQALLEIRP